MKESEPEPRKCRLAQFNHECGHNSPAPFIMTPCARAVSFSQLDPCVCEWGAGEEPAPKTAGRGGRRGADREAACEFLFYCITLLKKKKK